MSNGKARAAIEQMEAWVSDATWEPDPDELAQWNERFQEALAQSEQSDDWPNLVARAHAVGQKLETLLARMVGMRNEVKAELDAIDCGNRALRGYGSGTR